MADNERAGYVNALLRQKNNILASNAPLLNPSVEQAASLDTSIQGNTGLTEVNPTSKKDDISSDPVGKVLGFIDELAAKFGAGFVGGWEGILDLGATGLGALGESTGWYNGDVFTEWAKQDIGTAASEWSKEMFGLGSYYNRIFHGSGNFGKEIGTWGKEAWEGFNDIMSTALFHSNKIEGDYRSEANKYYENTDELTGFGEFLGGAAQSIGMMLPAIMTAGAASSAFGASAAASGSATGVGSAMTKMAAQYAGTAAKTASLATLGLGAAGKATEQALNEGADTDKALAYGIANGAVEVTSEILVGKVLKVLGLGTGKIAGVIGGDKIAEGVTKKSLVKELLKNANEEGAEEIFSAFFEPIIATIYKGSDALYNEDGKPVHHTLGFWLGTEGNFQESVLGSYLSGAFVGGLTESWKTYQTYKYYGNDVLNASAQRIKLGELDNKIKTMESKSSFDENNHKYQKLQEQRMSLFLDYEKSLIDLSKDKTKLNKFIETMDNPEIFMKEAGISEQEVVNKYLKSIDSADKANLYREVANVQDMFGTNYEIEIGDANGEEALIDKKANKIIIDNKYLEHGGSEFAHEYLVHAMWNTLDNSTKNSLYNSINKENAKFVEETRKLYEDKSEKVQKQEVVAKYFQKMFEAKTSSREMYLIRKAIKSDKGIVAKVQDMFDKQLKTIKNNSVFNQWKQSVTNFYNNLATGMGDAIINYATNGGEIPSRFSEYEGAFKEVANDINEEEKSLYSKNKKDKVYVEYEAEKKSPEEIRKEEIEYQEYLNEEYYYEDKMVDGFLTIYGVNNLNDFIKTGVSLELKLKRNGKKFLKDFDTLLHYYLDIKDVYKLNYAVVSNYNTGEIFCIFGENYKGKINNLFNNFENVKKRRSYLNIEAYLENIENGTSEKIDFSEIIGNSEYIKKLEKRGLINGKDKKIKKFGAKKAEWIEIRNNEELYKISRKSLKNFTKNLQLKNRDDTLKYTNLLCSNPYSLQLGGMYLDELQIKPFAYTNLMIDIAKEKKKLGVNVNFLLNTKNNDVMGYYIEEYENEINIFISSSTTEKSIIETSRHETMHLLEQSFPKEYDEVSTDIIKQLKNDKIFKSISSVVMRTWGSEYGLNAEAFYKLPQYHKKLIISEIMAEIYCVSEGFGIELDKYAKLFEKLENSVKKANNISEDTELLYSKSIEGRYTVGDNKKPLKVIKVAKGYDVTFTSEARTEHFNEQSEVSQYLKEIGAERVKITNNFNKEKSQNRKKSELTKTERENIEKTKAKAEEQNVVETPKEVNKQVAEDFTRVKKDVYKQFFDSKKAAAEDFVKRLGAEYKLNTKNYSIEKNGTKVATLKLKNFKKGENKNRWTATSYTLIRAERIENKRPVTKKPLSIGTKYNVYVLSNSNDLEQYKISKSKVEGKYDVSLLDSNGEVKQVVHEKTRAEIRDMIQNSNVTYSNDLQEILKYINENKVEKVNTAVSKEEVKVEEKKTEPKTKKVKEEKKKSKAEKPAKVETKTKEAVKEKVSKPAPKETVNTKIARQVIGAINNALSTPEYNITITDSIKNAANEIANARNATEAADRILKVLSLESTINVEGELLLEYGLNDATLKIDTSDESLRKLVEDYIKLASDPRSAIEAKAKFAEIKSILLSNIKEMRDRISQTRQVSKEIKKASDMIKTDVQLTDDYFNKNAISSLLNPFTLLEPSSTGYIVHDEFFTALQYVTDKYTPENFEVDADNNQFVEYSNKLENLLVELKSIGIESGKSLTAKQLELCKKAIREIKRMAKDARKRTLTYNKPSAIATAKAIKGSPNKNAGLLGVVNKFLDLVAAKNAQIRNYLGNSELSYKATTGLLTANNSKKLMAGDINSKLYQKVFELKLTKELGKKINLNGYMIEKSKALYAYSLLKYNAEISAEVDRVGMVFFDKHNIVRDIIEKGKGADTLNYLETTLSENEKNLSQFIFDEYNGEILEIYSEMLKAKGDEVNTIENYMPTARYNPKATSIDKAVYGVGLFKNAISKVKNNHSFVLMDNINKFADYTNDLANEYYIKPVYKDIIRTLNTFVEGTTSLKEALERSIGKDKVKYIQDAIDEMAGKKDASSGGLLERITNTVMTGYSLKYISFNAGTIMKQYLSNFTSNLPTSSILKGQFNRLTNKNFVRQMNAIIDKLGGAKYRSGVVEGELNNIGINPIQKVSELGMIPVKWSDKYTITTGVAALMVIGETQFDAKIGSPKNTKFVIEHFPEYEITQIGGEALSKNLIRQDKLFKVLFGFMQGAPTAATGSMVVKAQSWYRNFNVNEKALQQNIDNLEEEIPSLENAYNEAKAEEDNKLADLRTTMFLKDAVNDDEYKQLVDVRKDAENKLTEARADLVDNENRYRSYQEFKMMGGRAIPLKMAKGLVLQGMLMTLINELAKHIRGKKDWDDWFDEGTISEIILNSTVGLIPVLNVITNYMVKDYKIEVATASILTDMLDGIKTLTDVINGTKDTKALIQAGTEMFGNFTGINVNTFYDYATGVIRLFDAEKAIEMRNVWYNYSYANNLNTLKSYNSNNNTKSATRMLNVMFNNYKTRDASYEVRKEVNSLYSKGYDVMPKNYISSYTDEDGNTIKLTEAQISSFRAYYDNASKDIEELLKLTDYKSLTEEQRAKVIKKIYDTYYDAARIKVLGGSSSRLSNIMGLSSSSIQISQYVLYLQQIGNIVADNSNTRKEKAVSYINKLTSLSSNEKTLLMYLAGYGLSESAETKLSRFLTSKGISYKKVKELL